MKNPTLVMLCLFLTGPLAQAQVPPGRFAPFANDAIFTTKNLTRLGAYRAGATDKRIVQINFSRIVGIDFQGQWTVSMTLYDVSPTYGGSATGGLGFLTGQYDTGFLPHRFTLDKQVFGLNGRGGSNIMVEPRDGACCAWDESGGLWFSLRQTPNVRFPRPVRVTVAAGSRLPSGTRLHPVPVFTANTTIAMMYTDGKSILVREMRLTFSGTVLARAVMLREQVISTPSTGRPHSPVPIINKDGNLNGLFLGIERNSTDSDIYFQPGLNPKIAPQKVFDSPDYLGGGGVSGGRFFFANNGAGNKNTAASVGRLAWLAGSNTSLGQTAQLTCGVHNPSVPVQFCFTTLALSLKFNGGVFPGVAIGGFNGLFGLTPPLYVFGRMVAKNSDEVAFWNVKVPKDNQLVGLRIAVQGLSAPSGQTPTLTNTAHLEFKR